MLMFDNIIHIHLSQELQLDAYIEGTNCPGLSAFNKVLFHFQL